jgi:hypothetical protein
LRSSECSVTARSRSIAGSRLADAAVPLQPHDAEHDEQREQRRHAADRQKTPEIEPADGAQQMFCGLPIKSGGRACIGRRRERQRKRPRVEVAALRPAINSGAIANDQDVVG